MTTLYEQWQAAQQWERNWWLGNPQLYAYEIQKADIVKGWLGIQDAPHTSVIDIGCGPFSLLQRTLTGEALAVDPINYGPLEVLYALKNIPRLICRGEELHQHVNKVFDEAWIYNCLQHVEDPRLVLTQAMQCARMVRIFEWINIPPYDGHLHTITADLISTNFAVPGWAQAFAATGASAFSGLDGEFFVGAFTRTT